MNISFNPHYVLKNDDGCVLLLGKKVLADNQDVFNENVNSAIHPFHAKILSFINGGEYETTLDKISTQLNIDRSKIKRFVDALIENKHQIGPVYKQSILGFPVNTIIKSDYHRTPAYHPQDFDYDHLDVRLKRHQSPSTLTLMINNTCATDCVYCYADKRHATRAGISLARIKELLKEAQEIGVINFDLIGGEVFLYEQWPELIKSFLDNGFEPYLSTKYPLSENDVATLKQLGISHIQVSLDSLVPNHLKKVLRVNDAYIEKIKFSFHYLDQYKIPVVVHSIISKYGDKTQDITSLYEFLSNFHNIRYWLTEIAGPSIYTKQQYTDFKADKAHLQEISKTLDTIAKDAKFKVINGINKDLETESDTRNFEQKMNEFMSRGLCSGNFSHMYILPTGDVTICEELYWNPYFIIGNVNKQSLMEIWTGEKALRLYQLKQEQFPKDSVCSDCEFFADCRDTRQICYRDTIKAYGEKAWYYPDVNCPKAPKPIFDNKL